MSWILVSAYRKRNFFAVRIFNSAQTILNVWFPANYITNSAFVQDGCPDVIRSVPLTYGMSFNRGGKKKEEKNAAAFPPTCAAYIFPPEGSAGLILPTAVPVDRPSTPPGFSWTACRVCLASKQRTRLRRRSDSVNASRQSVCSGSSSPRDAAVCLPVWTRQRRRQARCLSGEILYRRRPPGENSLKQRVYMSAGKLVGSLLVVSSDVGFDFKVWHK